LALSQNDYRNRAYERAFGDHGETWLPANGFAANRPRIIKLYDYYRDTFNARPDLFLWAGLGRMAGGAVVGGLDVLTMLPFSDPSPITTTMVEIGKAIFDDLAWLHEAYIDDPLGTLALAAAHEVTQPARRSHAEAFSRISSGIPAQIAEGNKALLEIEQYSIIQPLYDRLRPPSPEWGIFRLTRTATSNVHPYHRDFINSFPNLGIAKDVTLFTDRWEWINLPGGMWEKWAQGHLGPGVGVASMERMRLVNLPFSKILARDFAPVDPSLEPPGSI
jgi:hypothetical protein